MTSLRIWLHKRVAVALESIAALASKHAKRQLRCRDRALLASLNYHPTEYPRRTQ